MKTNKGTVSVAVPASIYKLCHQRKLETGIPIAQQIQRALKRD